MKITTASGNAGAIETQALVTYVFDEENPVSGRLAELGQASELLRRLAKSSELTGKALEMTYVQAPAGLKAERLLVVGAGKKVKFGGFELRKLASAALRYLKSRGVKNLAFLAREDGVTPEAAQVVTEALLLADFEGDKYKTEGKKDAPFENAALIGWNADESVQKAIERGRIIADAQNFTRTLANEPSNLMTPKVLGERAAEMAREAGLQCDVLDEKRIAEMKMGALLSVAQGSVEPPRMIVITYSPAGGAAQGKPVLGLVGKAVTFDTGGISIKPAADMDKMKFDMSGGAAMIGAMKAIAQLKPAIKVIAVVPATENMPGGRAQKPGDVQTAMSGKTIEVLNTDAEGRLILADAVTYAQKLGCTHMVDAATLTGAIVVALAGINSGVFGTNEEFTNRVLVSAKAAGEKMWPMPMDDEYREMIKGTIADIQNISNSKGGGAITGAMFIREFVNDVPWVHLDIAGTAWLDDAKAWMAKGATGVGVRTLVDLAMKF